MSIKIVIKIFTTFILLVVLSSCRFMAATNKETAALNEQGSFSNGSPSWAKLPRNEKLVLPENAGAIPQTFTVPEAVSFSSQANASSSVSSTIGRGIEINKDEIKKQETLKKAAQEKSKVEDTSEIAKIEADCPGTESYIVEALKTEDINVRIKKYLILTKKCPRSETIWLWLAKDYASVGRTEDAKRCAQAALSLNSNNAEAKKYFE